MNRWWIVVCLALGACSGSTEGKDWDLSEAANNETSNNETSNNETSNNETSNNETSNNETSNNETSNNETSNNQTNNTPNCLPTVPTRHRAAARACTPDRAPGSSPPDPGDWECETDADCAADPSGRCTGNNHDGWYCTYNECLTDSECGNDATCECAGGFRSDHNVCLPGNCVTDADCGDTGFCSPSQGDCGAYFGTVGYFCHTCEDECVNDSDCGDGDTWGAYCMYDQSLSRWRCSESQCAG